MKLDPAYVSNLDGARAIPRAVEDFAAALPHVSPGDAVDLAITAMVTPSQTLDEVREHVRYVMDQLGRFAMNLDREGT